MTSGQVQTVFLAAWWTPFFSRCRQIIVLTIESLNHLNDSLKKCLIHSGTKHAVFEITP